jgi:hypothetical protein
VTKLIKEVNNMKKDSALKIIGLSALILVALWFVKALLFPMGYGMSMNYSMPRYMGNGYEHGFNLNYSYNNSPALILGFLIKILFIVFVVALLAGLVMVIKNHVFTPEDINAIKSSFTGSVKKAAKPCSECGKELNVEWKACPYCGKTVKDVSRD